MAHRNSPGFPRDLLWIDDPVIGTSQWLVVTHQGVFPLGFSVCRSARSHAYDSGVRLFLKREFVVSWTIIWPLSAIPGRWPCDIHIQMNNSVSMTRIIYILWIYMCQWHRLVYSVNIYVSMTQTSIGCELICANDTISYIRWIYVSMTQICIFYEYICVNDTD